ncbi:MAG: lytic transglycosylase domain-containing protein [Caulobacteraceae bacterium]|nr:lytic transglycosylase domain-containing protein [Caulobacteraceae bacterium]
MIGTSRATLATIALGCGVALALGLSSLGRTDRANAGPGESSTPPLVGNPLPTSFEQSLADPQSLKTFLTEQINQVGGKTGHDGAGAPFTPALRLTASDILRLQPQCAPATPAAALVSIVRVESGFQPLTIRVNGPHPQVYRPASVPEAVSQAQALLAGGANLDLGLAQINSRNLEPLGLSVADAFDPCRNLAGAAEILNRGYERALREDHGGRPILQMAYSIYNSGNTDRGLFNGYVAKVEAARRQAGS